MADDKKSFVLYTDILQTVKKMPKDKAGELFLTILSYVNDENPVVEDMIVDLVFEPIKQQLKRDLVKYETTKQKRAENGRRGGIKSGETRRENTSDLKQNEAIEANASFGEANEADNVNGNVNENDNVTSKRANALVPARPDAEFLKIELRKEYQVLVTNLTGKDVTTVWEGIRSFISQKSPPFIEPYQDAWNIFAGRFSLSKVETINDSRTKKFKTRQGEPAFDFIKVLEKIKSSKRLKGIDTNNDWKVTFDWVFENQSNYVKILEGNYD